MQLAQLREVASGVFQLSLPIPFENGSVNAYMLPGDEGVDLVDCGMNSPESLELLRTALREVGGRLPLRRVVVTHIHPDHYGAAGVLTNQDGAELYLHRLEVPLVHPRYLELEHLVAEVGRYLQIHGVPEVDAEQMRNASRQLRDFVTPAEAPVQLDGAETLGLGRRRLRVEWTPGHSPGHIVLFDPADHLLIAGDQLLHDTSPNIGLHPQSTPNPLDEYLAANQRLLGLRPAVVLPGHGEGFTDVEALVSGLAGHHQRRKERILGMMPDREVSAWQVALELWGSRPHLYEKRLALQEALAHLQSLAVEGALEKLVSAAAVSWRLPDRPA
jgi:glyoxylase-like metal-dependent hydrolase (beta-lactamase superfamily II)